MKQYQIHEKIFIFLLLPAAFLLASCDFTGIDSSAVLEELAGDWWLTDVDVYADGQEVTNSLPDTLYWPDSVFAAEGLEYPDSVFITDKGWYPSDAYYPNDAYYPDSVFYFPDSVFFPDSSFFPDSFFWPDSVFYPDSVFQHFPTRMTVSEDGSVVVAADIMWDTHGFVGSLGEPGQIRSEPTIETSISVTDDGMLQTAGQNQVFTTPRSGSRNSGFSNWPKNYEITENGDLILSKTQTIDGVEYTVEEHFSRETPGAPDFGGVLGWWEYTGKSSGMADYIHISPMDMASSFGLIDSGQSEVTAPLAGNIIMWSYSESDSTAGPSSGDTLLDAGGLDVGYNAPDGEMIVNQLSNTSPVTSSSDWTLNTSTWTYSISGDTLTIIAGSTTLTYDKTEAQ